MTRPGELDRCQPGGAVKRAMSNASFAAADVIGSTASPRTSKRLIDPPVRRPEPAIRTAWLPGASCPEARLLRRVRREDRLPLFLLGVDLLALVVSGIGPKDRLTWWMEVAPFLIALPVLLATYRRFRFTELVYVLIALHACVLFLGGHYTYAEVPLGFWAQRVLGLARNDYDRVGHFFQGFVPALVTREVLLRRTPLRTGGWLTFLVLSVCLAVSALYELVEWGAAVMLHQGADAFLGTQGDPWDTQEDMATCLVGAIAALVLLSRWHDRQLAALGVERGQAPVAAAPG